MPTDPFVGTWELDPSTIKYEFGRPGLKAVYKIEMLADGGMQFTLDAEDADKKPMHFAYDGLLDGSRQELPGGAVLILKREGPNRIDSMLEQEGKVVDHWSRELMPGGDAICFTQYHEGVADAPLRNVSVYRRVK